MVAEAGDLHAALRLGKTYDPAFLKQIGVRGIAGNPALAKSWYLKAIASGDKDADLRLLQLMALYPE
jgi:TPR repeat protein